MDRKEEAKVEYELALDKDPNDPSLQSYYARLLHERGRKGEAEERYKLALGVDPDDVNIHYNYGNLLKDMGRKEDAEEQYKLALKADPNHIDSHTNYGNLLKDMDRKEDAEEQYTLALKADPNDPSTNFNYGLLLKEIGRKGEAEKQFKLALEVYQKTIENDPRNISSQIYKGKILYNLKKYYKALKVFDKAINVDKEKNKGKTDALIGKGNIFFNLEMYKHALEMYDEALPIDTENFELRNKVVVLRNKAIIYYLLKKHAESRKAFKDALNLYPDDAVILCDLSEYHLVSGDIISAENFIEKALFVNEKRASSLILKGRIKIEQQNYIGSVDCFEEAISLDLMSPGILILNSYAKYLRTELKFKSNEKEYQDMIRIIIRELEKVEKLLSPIKNNYTYNIFQYGIKPVKKILTNLVITEKVNVKLLEILNRSSTTQENVEILAHSYYFLGFSYYKINDYITAVEYFKKCKDLHPDHIIKKSACDFLENIWCNQKHSIWKWWLYSPIRRWPKRFFFFILVCSLFVILLPSIASEIILSVYNLTIGLIDNSQPLSNLPIVESFISLINWKDFSISLTLLTSIIFFILVSPTIQNFKGGGIEITLALPEPTIPSLSLIERRLSAAQLSHKDTCKYEFVEKH